MKLTVAARMGFGFGLVLAAMIAGALIMTLSIGTVKERAMLIRSESLPLADEAARMQFETVNVQQFLTDVSATGEEGGFAEAEKSAAIFRQGVARFESLASRNGNTAQLAELKALSADFEAMYEQGVRMAKAYIKEGRAAGNVLMTDFDARTEALAKRIDPLKDKQFKAAGQRMTEVVGDLTSDLRLQYILLALSLCIGIGTALTLSRNILNQLGAEPETVAALAREVADGRFDNARALCAKGRSTCGVMSAMAAMAAKLEASFGEIASERAAAETKAAEADHSRQEAEQAMAKAEHARLEGMAEAADRLEDLADTVARATVSARSSSRSAASAMPSNRACSALAMACSASWRLWSASAALVSAAARSEAISPKEASSLAAMAAMADMTPQVERPLAHRARALSKRPSATSRARAATVSGSAPSWFRMLRDRVRAVPMPMQRDRASRMYWRRKSLVRSPTTSVMRWPAALNCLSLRGSMRLARASVRASKSVIRTLPAARPSLM